MHLDEIIAEIDAAHARGEDVARVHSGDPSIYGAIAEQMRRLDALGIPYEVVPGVPAFAGAAARHRHRADAARDRADHHPHPHLRQGLGHARAARRWRCSARAGATLAIHLSIRNLAYVETALTPHYGADCPVVIVYRATWPDEEIIVTTLAEMRARVREEKITRTALIFVGRVSN